MATDKLVEIDHVTDYISREAMHKANQDEWQGVYGFIDCDIFEENENMIDRVPAADVRPVVLCKDCKYYTEGKLLGPTKFCYFYKIGTGLNTADDDFCSKGERREHNLDTTKGEDHD